MNAIEARNQAYKINVDVNNSQYAAVKKEIEKAVKKGEYSTYFYEGLKSDVADLLKGEGFKISSYFDQRDGTTITISW